PAFALSAACVDLAALIEQTRQPLDAARMERNDARADKGRDEARADQASREARADQASGEERRVQSDALSLYERGLGLVGGDRRAHERARVAIARLRSEKIFDK